MDWSCVYPDALLDATRPLWESHSVAATPLTLAVAFLLAVSFLCWLLSVLMHNYSQVDRIWSVVPFVYVWIFVLYVADPRLLIMAGLSTLWGMRLSYNFYRKGGYNLKDEDYRWPALRETMHPILFQVFNVFFIAAYQNFLLFCFSALPAAVCWLSAGVPLGVIDYSATILFLFFFAIETIADEQQWRFQTEKYRLRNAGQPPVTADQARGFLTEGLFKYSRHPNFFSEQSLWWSFYLFSVSASGCWVNFSIIGAVQLSMLFQGSTDYTEKLSLKKYPIYAQYQQRTSRLMPWFPSAMPNKTE